MKPIAVDGVRKLNSNGCPFIEEEGSFLYKPELRSIGPLPSFYERSLPSSLNAQTLTSCPPAISEKCSRVFAATRQLVWSPIDSTYAWFVLPWVNMGSMAFLPYFGHGLVVCIGCVGFYSSGIVFGFMYSF